MQSKDGPAAQGLRGNHYQTLGSFLVFGIHSLKHGTQVPANEKTRLLATRMTSWQVSDAFYL